MARPNSKEAILDAAEAIVIESGAAHMTLDAVAERTGISKGGLIYNFPSKEALLAGMIGRMIERFDRVRDKIRQESNANDLAVEIRMLRGKTADDHRLSAALLAVTANQPELLTAMRCQLRDRFFNKITAEGDFMRSSILFFAALGLHFHDLLHLSFLDDSQREALYAELLRLAATDTAI